LQRDRRRLALAIGDGTLAIFGPRSVVSFVLSFVFARMTSPRIGKRSGRALGRPAAVSRFCRPRMGAMLGLAMPVVAPFGVRRGGRMPKRALLMPRTGDLLAAAGLTWSSRASHDPLRSFLSFAQ
jgi:hypothetical protein